MTIKEKITCPQNLPVTGDELQSGNLSIRLFFSMLLKDFLYALL